MDTRRGTERLSLRLILLVALMFTALLPLLWPAANAKAAPVNGYGHASPATSARPL